MPGFPDWLSQAVAQNQLLLTDQTINATGFYSLPAVPSWAYGVVWVASVVGANADFNPFYMSVTGDTSGAFYVYVTAPGSGGEPIGVNRPMIAHPVVSGIDASLTFAVRFIAGGSGHPVRLRAYAVTVVPAMPLPRLKVAAPGSIGVSTNLITGAGQSVYRLVGCSMALEQAAGSNGFLELQTTIGGALVVLAKVIVPASGYAMADFDLHDTDIDPGVNVVASLGPGVVDASPSLYYRQLI